MSVKKERFLVLPQNYLNKSLVKKTIRWLYELHRSPFSSYLYAGVVSAGNNIRYWKKEVKEFDNGVCQLEDANWRIIGSTLQAP